MTSHKSTHVCPSLMLFARENLLTFDTPAESSYH